MVTDNDSDAVDDYTAACIRLQMAAKRLLRQAGDAEAIERTVLEVLDLLTVIRSLAGVAR